MTPSVKKPRLQMNIDPFMTSKDFTEQQHQNMGRLQESQQSIHTNQKCETAVPQALRISRDRQQGSLDSSPSSSLTSSSPSHSIENPMNIDRNPDSAIDLSSDDSACMTSGFFSGQDDQHQASNPLHELQNSLNRNGILGQSISNGLSGGEINTGNNYSEACYSIEESNSLNKETLQCHICTFRASSVEEYNHHMDVHFDHKCKFCDYTSRTEGRLNRHIIDYHTKKSPKSWAGKKKPVDPKGNKATSCRGASTSGNQKPKITRCKQCHFTCDNKPDYFQHLEKEHISKDKILKCPNCVFVTEYKHHFEYHIRNHFGSKPFQCNKCNYQCVNKSMLNSHIKSHSKFYPYRCGECNYATKYCHSLKVHLRKYGHAPGQTLNPDGTPNPNPVIDVYGRRRGPKGKIGSKSKSKASSSKNKADSLPESDTSEAKNAIPNQPFIYPPPYFPANPFPAMLMGPSSVDIQMPSFPVWSGKPLRCYYCDFVTESREIYQQHVLAHFARENSDLIRTYNINPDVFHVQAQHLTFNNYPQNAIHYNNESLHKAESKNESQCTAVTYNVAENVCNSNSQNQSGAISTKKLCSSNEMQSTPNQSRAASADNTPNTTVYSPIRKSLADIKLSPENHTISSGRQGATPPIHAFTHQETNVMPKYCQAYEENVPSNGNDLTFVASSPMSSKSSSSHSIDCSEKSFKEQTDHYPLDLSNGKSCSTPQVNTMLKNLNRKYSSSAIEEISPTSSEGFIQSRNRRKGKAFKLDHYMKSDESPFKMDPTNTWSQHNDNKIDSTKANLTSSFNLLRKRSHEGDEITEVEMGESSIHYLNKNVFPFVPKHTAAEPPRNESYKTSLSSQNSQRSKSASPSSNYIAHQQPQNYLPVDYGHKPERNATPVAPKLEKETFDSQPATITNQSNSYMCQFCDMMYKDCSMYTMHMGYHGYENPFTCNKCGEVCENKVEFFLHLVRVAHR